jgi:hypothetical protein
MAPKATRVVEFEEQEEEQVSDEQFDDDIEEAAREEERALPQVPLFPAGSPGTEARRRAAEIGSPSRAARAAAPLQTSPVHTSSGSHRDPHEEKIDEVPSWDGDLATWRKFQRKVAIWGEASTTTLVRRGVRLLSCLSGDAWDATEDVDMSRLKSDDGVDYLMSYLEGRLEVDKVHLIGRAMEEFFFQVRREPKESVNKFLNRFKAAAFRLKENSVVLPDPALAFWLLKRANLTREMRSNVLTVAGGRYEFMAIQKALQVSLQSADLEEVSKYTADGTYRKRVPVSWSRHHKPQRKFGGFRKKFSAFMTALGIDEDDEESDPELDQEAQDQGNYEDPEEAAASDDEEDDVDQEEIEAYVT